MHRYKLDWENISEKKSENNGLVPQLVEMAPIQMDSNIVGATMIRGEDYDSVHAADLFLGTIPTACLLLSDTGGITQFWLPGRCSPVPDKKLHVATFPCFLDNKEDSGVVVALQLKQLRKEVEEMVKLETPSGIVQEGMESKNKETLRTHWGNKDQKLNTIAQL